MCEYSDPAPMMQEEMSDVHGEPRVGGTVYGTNVGMEKLSSYVPSGVRS